MKRNYIFEWYPTKEKRYGDPIVRTNMLQISNPCGKTEIDAKRATELFCKSFGNLHKNTIVKIKEIGDNGQIGEDIIPSNEEDAIIPAGGRY